MVALPASFTVEKAASRTIGLEGLANITLYEWGFLLKALSDALIGLGYLRAVGLKIFDYSGISNLRESLLLSVFVEKLCWRLGYVLKSSENSKICPKDLDFGQLLLKS
jgi:hypothetical protein